MCPLLGLAPGGVCLASPVTRPAVGSYPTLSPLPFDRSRKAVCFLWHFPSACAGRPLAVALSSWSPDFPPARSYPRTSGCPAFWSCPPIVPPDPRGKGKPPRIQISSNVINRGERGSPDLASDPPRLKTGTRQSANAYVLAPAAPPGAFFRTSPCPPAPPNLPCRHAPPQEGVLPE